MLIFLSHKQYLTVGNIIIVNANNGSNENDAYKPINLDKLVIFLF